jgi:hypothetical protein
VQAAQQSAGQDSEGSAGSAGPTAEQIREELVPLLLAAFQQRQKLQKRPLKGTSPGAPHNLAAITMLCMQSGYEDRAIDFMPALFAECAQQVRARLHTLHAKLVPDGCICWLTVLAAGDLPSQQSHKPPSWWSE